MIQYQPLRFFAEETWEAHSRRRMLSSSHHSMIFLRKRYSKSNKTSCEIYYPLNPSQQNMALLDHKPWFYFCSHSTISVMLWWRKCCVTSPLYWLLSQVLLLSLNWYIFTYPKIWDSFQYSAFRSSLCITAWTCFILYTFWIVPVESFSQNT